MDICLRTWSFTGCEQFERTLSLEEQINSKDKYLENKPLLAADMSANNHVRGQDIFRQKWNECKAEKRSFEGKRRKFQDNLSAKDISADMPAARRVFICFKTPPLIFVSVSWQLILLTFLYFPVQYLRTDLRMLLSLDSMNRVRFSYM